MPPVTVKETACFRLRDHKNLGKFSANSLLRGLYLRRQNYKEIFNAWSTIVNIGNHGMSMV